MRTRTTLSGCLRIHNVQNRLAEEKKSIYEKLAFAPFSVCNVRKPVVPGCIVIVTTSFAMPPTVNVGEPTPNPAPVLFMLIA
jgi:hypothetical protein